MNKKLETEFLQLFQDNQGIAHKICHLYGKTEVDKKDLFQEITIQLWRAFPTFKGTAKFSTWMYRVALNTAITSFRKSKKRRQETGLSDDVRRKLTYQEFDPSTEEKLKFMYSAIDKLNPVEKALVFLYLEDKPYREISQTLGISEVNARVKMNRIKDKLRKLMKV